MLTIISLRLPGAALVAATFLSACGPYAQDHKAVASTEAAATAAGDFSDDDRRAYAAGVQHIERAHGRLGALTIWEVLHQERAREQARADARTAADDRKRVRDAQRTADRAAAAEHKKARDANRAAALVVTGENADVAAAFSLFDQVAENPLRGHSIDDKTLSIAVDDDLYSPMSGQDRDAFKASWYRVWSAIYDQRHHVTADGITVNIYDLNGKLIDYTY